MRPVAIKDPITPGPNGHGSGLKLRAGLDHLTGRQALQFWRARYALADGSDLARIARDQYLMGQIVKGVLHSKLLSSPATLYRVVGDVASSMSTDASTTDLVKITTSLSSVSTNNVQFVTAPTVPYPADPAAELQFAQPQAAALFSAIAQDRKLPKEPRGRKAKKGAANAVKLLTNPSLVKVTVLNGTTTSGLAAKVGTELAGRGFTVVGAPGNAARSDYATSVIEYGSAADRAAADTLAQQISPVRVALVPGVGAGPVQLILGSSFTALTAPAQPLGSISGSFTATSGCRNSAFFGANLPAPTGRLSCACS